MPEPNGYGINDYLNSGSYFSSLSQVKLGADSIEVVFTINLGKDF
jgi:hypothetical protein